MKSYRVRCGSVKETVEAESLIVACCKALKASASKPGKKWLSIFFEVKKRGKEALYRSTVSVLRELDKIEAATWQSDSETEARPQQTPENKGCNGHSRMES